VKRQLKNRSRNGSSPTLERLEDRCLLASILEFRVPGGFGAPLSIASGPDGNLWFTQASFSLDTATSDHVGQITTSGSVKEFPVPLRGVEGPSAGLQITKGPDGNLWYTEFGSDKVARLTPAGVVTEFAVPPPTNNFDVPQLNGITAGPDGNLWFTESTPHDFPGISKIARITPAGVITEFTIPSANESPMSITLGPDNNLWYTVPDANKVGRITVNGDIQEFQVPRMPNQESGLGAITAGPDGNLWFVEQFTSKIGRMTTQGALTEFSLPAAGSFPSGITSAPDGNIWFTEQFGNKIGRISTSGTITEFAIPTANSNAQGITVGPNGNLWFTEGFGDNLQHRGGDSQIGEVVIDLPTTPNGRFVSNLYVDLLGRLPDSGGQAAWTSSLNAGATRAQVVQGFEASVEYRTDVVEHVYNLFLHRSADPAGLANSLALLANGGTELQLQALVAGSPEYFQARGGSTNDGFLTALYQDTLNRGVDPSGKAAFDSFLATGGTTTRAAAIVLTSPEYDQDLVTSVYQHYLQRLPDPGGMSAWLGALQAGMSQEQFLVGVLGSDEYFARV
jgi:streptogramin lyase